MENPTYSIRNRVGAATGVGIATGLLSAVTLNPMGDATEGLLWWPDELLGLIAVFSLSAGLIFGLGGGAFGRLRLRFSWPAVVVFALTSMGGIAAAVYAAVIIYDYEVSVPSLMVPYLAASLVGALIMAVPVALLARLAQPLGVMAKTAGLTTLWSVAIAIVMRIVGTEDVMSVPWLIPLFCGWQALFLMVIAAADRKV